MSGALAASPLPLLLAVAGATAYHLAQKSVPGDAAPFVVIAVAYLAGFVASVGAVLAGGAPVAETVRAAWKPAVAIGLSALTIEAGFLLAYRAGWPISTASLISNTAVAVLLLGAGLALYRETLTAPQWLGAALCLAGLALLAAR